MSEPFISLEAAIRDPRFAEVDVALRSGVHVDREDLGPYTFLEAAREVLEDFYAAYDCRLAQGAEGYFYLVSEGLALGQRRLSLAEMLVGQVLALMWMDPAYLRTARKVTQAQVLQQLELLLPHKELFGLLAPRSRGRDQETDARKIRETVSKALRELARLGFVHLEPKDEAVALRRAVMRFCDPVRDAKDRGAALANLVQKGEVALPETEEVEDE